jgi:serine/threonine protein kinase
VWLGAKRDGCFPAVKIVYRDRFQNDGPYAMEFEGLRQFHDVSREHDGFVDILHVSRNDEAQYFYYVMELADDLSAFPHRREAGEIDPDRYTPCTLASLLARRRRLPPAECIELALDLAAALIDLHRRRLVHRDIKPSNIILIKGVRVWVTLGWWAR